MWDSQSGKLLEELFGPTHYGASGGAIWPKDPDVMVGEGCEWRLVGQTAGGHRCVGVIEPAVHSFARFCTHGDRDYLAVATSRGGIKIFQRLAPGDYALRASVTPKQQAMEFWSDANGDRRIQDSEVQTFAKRINLTGYTNWSAGIGTDLTLYGSTTSYYDSQQKGEGFRFTAGSFTDCGAPLWDVESPQKLLPSCGAVPSPDNVLVVNQNGAPHSQVWCYETATGRRRWEYPSQWAGMHGSHHAPPPAIGLMRGVFGCIGAARFPEPLGHLFIFNSDVGEYHVLTGEGFYLTGLFQPDPLKLDFPAKAEPGAIMDNAPPGMGGEDFGGSVTQGIDGKLYIQAGKTALWNLEVVGLQSVRPLGGGTLEITPEEVVAAHRIREMQVQAAIGVRRLVLKRLQPKFTGNLPRDFADSEIISFKKQQTASVRAAAAWDDRYLYLAWDVLDNTPWVNAAGDPAMMYLSGDTVDFQLGIDPSADKDREEAVGGDLRLSIGNFDGRATVVLYRKVSPAKRPRTFRSGVVPQYTMDFVDVVRGAKIEIAIHSKKGYLIEAAIPLSALGLQPADGLTLRGDFGATHGGPDGRRTRLRTHWSNQHTGIVDDAVFELKMTPKNWGELVFKQ